MKNILVATDLSARSDRAILRAIKLAKQYGAQLTILHVIDSDTLKSIAQELKKVAEKEIQTCIATDIGDIKYNIEIISGCEYFDILTFIAQKNFDLVVLGIHRHINQKLPFIGKTIERLIRHCNVPLLIAKERAEDDYKDIMISVDFNIHSKQSIRFVLNYFKKSTFHLIHAFHVPFSAFVRDNVIEQQVFKQEQEKLAEFLSKEKLVNDDQIKKIIRKGDISIILDEEISTTKPNLLVLGTHGRSGISHVIFNSLTEKLLINPPCDILAIKA